MNHSVVPFVAALLLATSGARADDEAAMKRDLQKMVRAAHRQPRLMPWRGPVPEVDLVARHGKAIAPLLIVLLPDDPDSEVEYYWSEGDILAGRQFDYAVEQNAAAALCRIYGIQGRCPMYEVRSTAEHNREVKPFWLKTIAENQ